MAGILDENVRVISTTPSPYDDGDGHSLGAQDLLDAVQRDRPMGFIPFFVGTTLGTTSATHWDRLDAVGPVCKQEKLFLHVDAACGLPPSPSPSPSP